MSGAKPNASQVPGQSAPGPPTNSAAFAALKDQCLRTKATTGKLYEDPQFKAEAQSMYYSIKPSKLIEWKRPHEICAQPQFIIDGATRFDLDQGELDNCWFIAAAATLATKPELLKKVVPQEQSFANQYAGLFNFFFWRYGEWQEVIIDDRLPVKYGKLVFCHNKEQPNEFWSALLEKAYAKLNGSYEALRAGKIQDALVDFTGGVGEVMTIQDRPADQLFQLMIDFENMNTLMGCSISIPGIDSGQAVGQYGLINRHAYCITDVVRVQRGSQRVRLIRLLNPWGKVEWTGPWSENSAEWNEVADDIKSNLAVVRQDDGEFWMCFDDWRKNFTELQLCHLTSSSLNRKNWFENFRHGAWRNGINAGGCGEPPDSDRIWINPQYCVTITPGAAKSAAAAGSAAKAGNKPPTNLIISLMQKYRRELQTQLKVVDESLNLSIGYRVYLIKDNQPVCINSKFIPEKAAPLEESSKTNYLMMREVTYDFSVAPGIYCIIPTTQFPGQEADFLLRVLTPQQAELKSIEELNISPQAFTLSHVAPRSGSVGPALDGSIPPSVTSQPSTDNTIEQSQKHRDELFALYHKTCAADTNVTSSSMLQTLLNAVSDAELIGPYKLSFGRAEARQLYAYCTCSYGQSLTFDVFQTLIIDLNRWMTTFVRFDKGQSQNITFSHLWKVFTALGYKLENKPRQVIMTSYGDPETGVHVIEFISCLAKIFTAEAYSSNRKTTDGKCKMTLPELIQLNLMT